MNQHFEDASSTTEDAQDSLLRRLRRAADYLQPAAFMRLLDSLAVEVLQEGIANAGADEGTLWIVEPAGDHLVPVFNSGPNNARIVGHFRQPLNSGLICMVFATEQPFVENDVQANARQSKLLDMSLGVQTNALIAVPLHYLGACRGVISCVHLAGQTADESHVKTTFSSLDLAEMERASALLSRLIELKLLRTELRLE